MKERAASSAAARSASSCSAVRSFIVRVLGLAQAYRLDSAQRLQSAQSARRRLDAGRDGSVTGADLLGQRLQPAAPPAFETHPGSAGRSSDRLESRPRVFVREARDRDAFGAQLRITYRAHGAQRIERGLRERVQTELRGARAFIEPLPRPLDRPRLVIENCYPEIGRAHVSTQVTFRS